MTRGRLRYRLGTLICLWLGHRWAMAERQGLDAPDEPIGMVCVRCWDPAAFD